MSEFLCGVVCVYAPYAHYCCVAALGIFVLAAASGFILVLATKIAFYGTLLLVLPSRALLYLLKGFAAAFPEL